MTEKEKITDVVTEPLTERRGDMTDYIIGGIEAPFIEGISQKVPIVGQNQFARGLGQVAAAFILSRTKTGTNNGAIKHVKTGTEIGLATVGAANTVAGVAGIATKLMNRNKTATQDTYMEW